MPYGGDYSSGSKITGSDIAAWIKNMVVKVRHVDAHVPKNRATEEQQNNPNTWQHNLWSIKTMVALYIITNPLIYIYSD